MCFCRLVRVQLCPCCLFAVHLHQSEGSAGLSGWQITVWIISFTWQHLAFSFFFFYSLSGIRPSFEQFIFFNNLDLKMVAPGLTGRIQCRHTCLQACLYVYWINKISTWYFTKISFYSLQRYNTSSKWLVWIKLMNPRIITLSFLQDQSLMTLQLLTLSSSHKQFVMFSIDT